MKRHVFERVEYSLSADEVKAAIREWSNGRQSNTGFMALVEEKAKVTLAPDGSATVVACEADITDRT